jgi:DNA repair exonuclease SbcCD nuclease subunit
LFNFFLSSDLHFDLWKPFSHFLPDGTTDRLWKIRQVLEEGLKKANTDTVIYTGDIIHNSRTITPILANFVRNYFESLKDKRVIVFPGNHCLRMGGFKQPQSMLAPILPNHTEYYGQPTSLNITQDIVLHILPFYPDITIMKEQLHSFKLQHDRINILLSHFTVGGSKLRDDFNSETKYGSISQTDLKIFDYSILGDCHYGNQELDGRIFIPGTPVQMTFGEEGQDKFTYKIGISSKGVTKERYLSNAPAFKTLYINSEEDIQQISQIDKENTYLRVFSKIPLGHKVDTTKFVYIESPKEVQLEKNLDYKDIIREFVKGKNPELVGLLGEYI